MKVLQSEEGKYSTNWKLIQFEDQPEMATESNIQDDIGMELLCSTPVPLSGGRSFVLVKDPNEIFIELIGPIQ